MLGRSAALAIHSMHRRDRDVKRVSRGLRQRNAFHQVVGEGEVSQLRLLRGEFGLVSDECGLTPHFDFREVCQQHALVGRLPGAAQQQDAQV
jgi:hypothetical protein